VASECHTNRKFFFALPRSVALDALEALVRILARYLALKLIQRAVRDLHAVVALERYIWRGIYYPRRVLSQLPFERYTWWGVYYPCRVPSQVPLARSMHDELFSPRTVWRSVYYPGRAPSRFPLERCKEERIILSM
jgi:hypothetical protein